jgi:DinB family
MAAELSFETIVSRLEAQIAFDREREAFHAGQEAFHREQRALFAAELEKLTSILESFKTAATAATELASRAAALPPPAPNLDIGRKPSLTRMVMRILEIRPAGDALSDVPRIQLVWFLVHDQIHHRGQFSIYLRMADAKVPSIYGPTADEPWM